MVADKLRALKPDTEEEASDGRALIVIRQRDTELIESYLRNELGDLRNVPRAELKANEKDLIAGMKAGSKAELGHGLGAAGSTMQQIGGQ